MKEKTPSPPDRWSKLLDYDAEDFHGERGCCLTCMESQKDQMEGVEYDIWFGSKHYDCMCLECKCTKCYWYNSIGKCDYLISNEFGYGHFVTGGVALVLKKLSKPQFLTVEDVPQGSIVTVAEEPYIVPAEQTKWGKERGRVVVRLGNDELRTWTMNNTTWDALVDAFGAEPQSWVGKKIQIDIQQMNVRGETKRVIFGKPYAEPQKELPT